MEGFPPQNRIEPLAVVANKHPTGIGSAVLGGLRGDSGFVAPGFEPVRAQFERNFTQHAEVGASVCVYQGTPAWSIYGGYYRPHGRHAMAEPHPYQYLQRHQRIGRAGCVAIGRPRALDLDAPITDIWPEFGRAGKAALRFVRSSIIAPVSQPSISPLALKTASHGGA